jgi:hypothetical protein
MSFILYASGPSAAYWPRPTGIRTACVNASHQLVDRPNVYAVGEIQAGAKLQGTLRRMVTVGTKVYVRPGVKNIFDLEGTISVGKDFGPQDLRDLHDDVEWGESPVPDYGQRRSWISTGVLLLWILADVYRPKRIYVAGMDGYPDEATAHKDYASGLPNLGYEDLDVDGLRRRQEMNLRMAEGIKRISSHPDYQGTEFIWLSKPNLCMDGWNARLVNADDIRSLYPGYNK